ncbi:MAG: bifunctional metallophosphatase/5'-nucleotidase [Elusimicrobiota bacterium]
MKYFKRLIAGAFLAVLCLAGYWYYWNKNVIAVNIAYTSDGHGHIRPSKAFWEEENPMVGGFGSLKTYLNNFEEPYILTDSGDFFQGTPEGMLTEGELVVKLMNKLGYDALAAGNHDFDLGKEKLRTLTEIAEFPVLGANIFEKDTGSIPAYLEKNIILDYPSADINIGLTGVITPAMEELSISDNIEGLEFRSPVEIVNKNAGSLKEKGADIVVVLSHQGVKRDIKMAEELKNVDVILGGHTHRRIEKPLKINDILIFQPGSNFNNIGKLKFYYNTRNKKPVAFFNTLELLYTEKYKPDPGITEFIKNNVDKLDVPLDKKIGKATEELTHYLTGEQERHGELPLGNWQTDLMREFAEADFAFHNIGGIRATIPRGDIKVRDIWQLSPFGNTLVKMNLTGQQIKKLLEHSAAKDTFGLQVSGLKVIYNSSLPEGNRVLNIIDTATAEDGEDEPREKELDLEDEYTVVTNSFLAQGGDGYTVFKQGEEVEELPDLLRDVQIDYIKENSTVTARVEERLTNISLEN